MMVEEQDRKDAVLLAMSDTYMRRILAATMTNEKSIDEISREKIIPSSTCYRRVSELVALRLLRVERTVITGAGKRYEKYRSTFSDAKITMIAGELLIDVTVIPRMSTA
jgi:hypothetical protein